MRRLLALTCAIFLIDTEFYAALVPLVPYCTEDLRLSKSMAGVLGGAVGVGVILEAAPGAYWATQLGVRPTALVGLGLISIASLLFGFASGTWELVTLRLSAGFGSALSWISALAWLSAETPIEQRRQMLGTLGSSPLLFGALAVLAALNLARLDCGATGIGSVFLVATLFETAAHPILGRWFDRSGYRPPILAGLLTSLGILLALPWLPVTALVALLVVLAGVAFNAPLIPGTALLSLSAEKVGVAGAIALGAASVAWASGYVVRASLDGTLAGLGGDTLSYLSLAALCLLALIMLRRWVAE